MNRLSAIAISTAMRVKPRASRCSYAIPIVCFLASLAALAATSQRCSAQALANNNNNNEAYFEQQVVPILERSCVHCHNAQKREGELALDSRDGFRAGGESGPVFDPQHVESSSLLRAIMPHGDEPPAMPKGRPALTKDEVNVIRRWLADGAAWAPDRKLLAKDATEQAWWSLEPLRLVAAPVDGISHTEDIAHRSAHESLNYIDAFLRARQQEVGLVQAQRATRRELIRRVTFDLTGLPPDWQRVEQFVHDDRPDAYEREVDRLLASPAYGERWARHWLDVVHYGETHGYDKDKPRPNAWPYRDYVIRAFNSDKDYRQFVAEQVAGDVLEPDNADAIEAVGFLSAGPWDFIGHAEVPETKLDGRIARHLDRDDMVQNTFLTFQSVTVGCAQCHDHKFDPITQREYYGLQAVFAALDRTDRQYYREPERQREFAGLQREERQLVAAEKRLQEQIKVAGGEELARIDRELADARANKAQYPAQHGYHSSIESSPEKAKWVQVDLGESIDISRVTWIACHDDFAGIGDGFGAPAAWRIEASDDADFRSSTRTIAEQPYEKNAKNPGVQPQNYEGLNVRARYIRFTATRLAERKADYMFALAELQVFDAEGKNLALNRPVAALDSIEAPIRWSKSNLVDGKYPTSPRTAVVQELTQARDKFLARTMEPSLLSELKKTRTALSDIRAQLKNLPAPAQVYVATIHFGQGTFLGTGPNGGTPRAVQVLPRGDVSRAGPPAEPCGLDRVSKASGLSSNSFGSLESHDADRRQRLAAWLTHADNPLTWRSMANRLWAHHFDKGIVDTPNDFGRMGSLPSHPELLDQLAIDLRDHQSLKRLQRGIVTSATYQQSSTPANAKVLELDPTGRLLASFPRKRLEAEAIRDAMLSVSGLLRREMGGPSYQDFVIERPEHSPHYEYHLHDPRDAATMRRSIYRFIVRSQTQPMLTSLDCADPSMQVDVRGQSTSATQALVMLNNSFTIMAAEEWAERVESAWQTKSASLSEPQLKAAITLMFRSALSREPTSDEVQLLLELGHKHGLVAVARTLFNANEFAYVD